ncbi:MAG: PrgI family protein [Parcubacteria group bacterium]|nr:PrgI family protein [Parcubacteria group bacterium]
MRFQTPQFIEVEDKIFGPLTLKQFIYLAGGAGFSFIFYRALPLYLAIFLIAPVVALSLALAFYKVNDRNFIHILEAAVRFLTRDKLYLWQKRERLPEERGKEAAPASDFFVPRLSESKLKDIAWSLDVHESIYAGQKQGPESKK